MPVGNVTWRHTFRALRHRNYRLFFWGQLVSLVGTWMQQTAMSWFVYQITNSKLLLGVVAAVGSAPMMLSSMWGGSLADRHPKRSILLATQTAQMVCAFFLAAGVLAGFATPSFIIVIAALNGVAMGFDCERLARWHIEAHGDAVQCSDDDNERRRGETRPNAGCEEERANHLRRLGREEDRALRMPIGKRAAPDGGQHHRSGSDGGDDPQQQL